MKYSRFLRMLGIILILSLMLMAVPTLPVFAYDYDIELTPTSGKIGDTITIVGDDFSPSTETSEKWARIIFAEDEAIAGNFIDNNVQTYEVVANAPIGYEGDNDEGEFYTSFTVPSALNDGTDDESVTSGTYYIYVTLLGYTTIKSVTEFTVTAGAVTITPTAGPVDTAVRITGTGFAASTTIVVKYDGTSIAIDDGDVITKTTGAMDSYIYAPESVAGSHTITVTVGGSEISGTFTVQPDIIISPQSGEAGTTVLLSCTGFGRRLVPTVFFNAYPVETLTPVITDTKGSFSTSFIVPEGLNAGVYLVEADDQTNLATVSFTLTVPQQAETPTQPETPTEPETPTATKPTLSIKTSGDTIGSNIVIVGSGFTPNTMVTVKYDDTEVTAVTADTDGLIMAIFPAPPSQHGDHVITVSDGTHTNTINYTVESVSPDTPPPLLPEIGSKVKSPATFDWDDVTDDSMPVTYNLQIATDYSFAESSIVLDIPGIELSGYILCEAEELKLAGREDAYYWRVRAVDAASNPSEWTGSGEFYFSGGAGSFPTWAIYTLGGIGAVLLFVLGYWLGRRTAFYY